jgi:hypothetical protein
VGPVTITGPTPDSFHESFRAAPLPLFLQLFELSASIFSSAFSDGPYPHSLISRRLIILLDWGGYRMAQADQVVEIASFLVIALTSSLLFRRERRALEGTAGAHRETIAALASATDPFFIRGKGDCRIPSREVRRLGVPEGAEGR